MSLRSLLLSLSCLLLSGAAWASCAFAGASFSHFGRLDDSDKVLKPISVIYFTGHGSHSIDYDDSIKTIILESGREFKLNITEHALDNEADLAATIDEIANGETGLIVIIEPHDMEALMKIPPLFPDIRFSVIGVEEPMYLINVNSMLFKDQEGTYISGALAALQSRTGIISFICREDVPYTRNLAYAYFQGAKYINPGIQVIQQLGTRYLYGNKIASPLGKKHLEDRKNADITFVLDDEPLDAAIRQARKNKQLIIATTPDALDQAPDVVLTSLLKHYDLALYAAIRNYAHFSWAPVSEEIGLGNGYIDYIVDARNRALFSTENIERIERTKDLVAQGIITITTLQ